MSLTNHNYTKYLGQRPYTHKAYFFIGKAKSKQNEERQISVLQFQTVVSDVMKNKST